MIYGHLLRHVYQSCIELVAVLVITSYSMNLRFCLWNLFFFFFFSHICTKMDEKLVSFSMKLQLSSSISDELLKLDFGEVCSRDTSLK